ncbi:MAG: site-specific integrase [Candidatus Sericytochromatia bacterium]|nr:site-specific integrase [Candidatus Sericytochromatia bacterium]
MTRTRLGQGRYGDHGHTVSLFVEGDRIVAVWRDKGLRRKKSWPNTKEARKEAVVWAKAFAEYRVKPVAGPVPLTTQELWLKYAEAEFPTLRPKTQRLYAQYWRQWEAYVSPERVAEDLGMQTITAFRGHLEGRGLAPSTIGQILKTVKTVYSWGHRLRYISRDEMRDYRYKVAKEQRLTPPGEYRQEELDAILAHLPLEGSRTWRAHAVLALCGLQGVRQNAVLHLRWEDIDPASGTVTWRAAYDKVGREWTQPLRAKSLAILEAVRPRTGGTGWVFPVGSKKSGREVYSGQSLWAALRRAEDAAGVPHRERRAAHGLRRMLFNDVLAETGDIGAAMSAINDTDLRVASRYLKGRDDRVKLAFAALDAKQPPNSPLAPNPETLPPRKLMKRKPLQSAPRRNRTYNLADFRSGETPEVVGISGVDDDRNDTETPRNAPEGQIKRPPNGPQNRCQPVRLPGDAWGCP